MFLSFRNNLNTHARKTKDNLLFDPKIDFLLNLFQHFIMNALHFLELSNLSSQNRDGNITKLATFPFSEIFLDFSLHRTQLFLIADGTRYQITPVIALVAPVAASHFPNEFGTGSVSRNVRVFGTVHAAVNVGVGQAVGD